MEQLLTRWGRELNKELPLNDYPRPQMRRDSFLNLNGLWDYAILPKEETLTAYQGKIVVPFSPEALLSGVNRTVTPDDCLYYRRTFAYHKTGDRALLHFGAVDYECRVTLNGTEVGGHKGGYYPFTFDVTEVIREGENELRVSVTDPSETGSQASGKQTSKRGQIWYTPQSGIWQTVWLEEVPDNYIVSVKLTPDIDTDVLQAEVTLSGEKTPVTFTVLEQGVKKTAVTTSGRSASIKLSDYRLWSPEDPFLYDLEVTCGTDTVLCYFGMRKFAVGKD
ncbi:MAG: glycoside hydrolase family 2, partial [Clostridia bacterium]|nr:glycoside hydrolase family 2 [Clostridia bacterium]